MLRFKQFSRLMDEAGEGGAGGGDGTPPKGEGEGASEKDKFVPASAYEKSQSERQAAFQENKDLKARLAQMEADEKNRQTKEMEEKQQFQELYEKEKAEKEALNDRLNQNEKLFKDSIKKSYLKEALGANIKDEYLNFADIDQIQLDDSGRPTEESLKAVSDKFKNDHAALIPRHEGSDASKIPPGSGPGKETLNIEDVMNDRDAFHELMRRNKQ